MKFFRLLLLPVSWLYGLFIRMRNKAFDWKFLRSETYSIPVMGIGNLIAGGSGKTPLVEYVVRLLGPDEKLAVLSRGYKRKTHGYMLAGDNETVQTIGDEPLQYHSKFSTVNVAVCERRREGIRHLLKDIEGLQTIVLDDAFQHRYVKPRLSILVTDYFNPYNRDWLLPAGLLREPASGSKRADIIVVTKTPRIFSPIVRKQMLSELNALPQQIVCFSYIDYLNFTPLFSNNAVAITDFKNVYSIIMFTGIGNPDPFEEYLKRWCTDLEIVSYGDHHVFTDDELKALADKFTNLPTKRKIIVTTEKDAMRLRSEVAAKILGELPIFYVPICFEFFPDDKAIFDKTVLEAARSVKA